MILCDIGNTHATFFENGVTRHVPISTLQPEAIKQTVFYISVNCECDAWLNSFEQWKNIAHLLARNDFYDGMGVDRKAVCHAVQHGVIVDAGSAVTIDVMEDGVYRGGAIALGKFATKMAAATISERLQSSYEIQNKFDTLANNTEDALTLGYYLPLMQMIRSFKLPIFLCGGDASSFKVLMNDATVDDTLVFKGMLNVLSEVKC